MAHFRALNFCVWCYRGNIATPMWKDVDTSESSHINHLFSVLDELVFADNFTKLCTIEADLSRVIVTQPKAKGKGIFYKVHYDIILLFGMTEFKAQVAWRENVSGPLMLFHKTDIELILCVVFRELKNGKFFKLFLS